MLIRIRDTGQVVGNAEFRRLHSSTSFPETLTNEILDSFGADQVFPGNDPELTSRYQFVFEQGIEKIDNKWYTKKVIGPVFTDNEEGTAAQQEAAYKSQKDAEAAKAVRADRDRRLAECDWVVIKNLELNQNIPGIWEVYRQNLRDVPAQAGFPYDITWPKKP